MQKNSAAQEFPAIIHEGRDLTYRLLLAASRPGAKNRRRLWSYRSSSAYDILSLRDVVIGGCILWRQCVLSQTLDAGVVVAEQGYRQGLCVLLKNSVTTRPVTMIRWHLTIVQRSKTRQSPC